MAMAVAMAMGGDGGFVGNGIVEIEDRKSVV